MRMWTLRRLIKAFVGWHNAVLSALPLRNLPMMYVQVSDWWIGWDPNHFLLVPLPSVFTNYSGLMLWGSEAEKAQVWRISITYLLVFVLVSFVSGVRYGVILSKTADLPMVSVGLGVLVPIIDRLAGWIINLNFFPIICKTLFGPVPAYAAFCREQEVNWSCVDLEDPFCLYRWHARKVIGLAYKHARAQARG